MSPFRVAVRAFAPFESAIRKQWESFESQARTGLTLEAVPLDLHSLHAALFEHSPERWDAAFLVTDWIAEAAAADAVRDLATYLATDCPEGYPDAWTSSLLRFQRVDGRVLGLPYHDGPECLIYRKDLFDEAGLTPPRTWEEFHQIARQLARPAENRFGAIFAAFPDGHNAVYDFCLQLWSRGGELFDAAGHASIDTEPAREALRFYRGILRDASAVHPCCADFDSVKSGYAFARGEAALMANWFGFAAMCETWPESKVRGKVAVAGLPGGVSLNVYWTLAIPASCSRPGLAWSFLRHCASAEMDKLLTMEGGIGCRKSTWSDAGVNRVIPFYREMERIHAGARELPRMSNWARIAALVDALVLEAAGGNRPEDALLAEAQRAIVNTL
ncbi:Extracellular solute-binding protein family 1 [Candidatus Sulfopaludibacter sp. SbA3]|nr:Extracellular solute-binding protein family 1 [Candidatus Sulfopaludibacter sp. SbA3]